MALVPRMWALLVSPWMFPNVIILLPQEGAPVLWSPSSFQNMRTVCYLGGMLGVKLETTSLLP